jgi:hypothetical protein
VEEEKDTCGSERARFLWKQERDTCGSERARYLWKQERDICGSKSETKRTYLQNRPPALTFIIDQQNRAIDQSSRTI